MSRRFKFWESRTWKGELSWWWKCHQDMNLFIEEIRLCRYQALMLEHAHSLLRDWCSQNRMKHCASKDLIWFSSSSLFSVEQITFLIWVMFLTYISVNSTVNVTNTKVYIYTPIRHNMMTTCLIVCRTLDSVVSGTKTLSGRSFKSCKLRRGASVERTCLSSTTHRLDRDLGNLEAEATPQTRCCVPQTILEPFLLKEAAAMWEHRFLERVHVVFNNA